jgi:hypothetical protein
VPDEQVPDGRDAGGVRGGGHGQEEDGEAQADHCQVGQACHPYLVCLWIFMVLRTEVKQNKYCNVVVKLKEFFYVDYHF